MRAPQTPEILAAQYDLKVEIVDALREFDCGILEGRSDEKSRKDLFAMWDDWILQGNWSHGFEQGESFEDIQARFLPFIDSLRQRFHDETMMLVGHGGTFRAMLPLILENIDFPFSHQNWIPNAGYVGAELRKGSLFCTHWGDAVLS
jgi:probable phosphoglycerate mutase